VKVGDIKRVSIKYDRRLKCANEDCESRFAICILVSHYNMKGPFDSPLFWDILWAPSCGHGTSRFVESVYAGEILGDV